MYHGKVIYNPSGKAGEYSQWAANFYNGCSAKCSYCYNRTGITAKVLGGDVPTLKKCLINKENAVAIFCKELKDNLSELQKHGLFFNFVSDPCLKATYELNSWAWEITYLNFIPVKILTKQTWWIDEFINNKYWEGTRDIYIGFTLTGHDELEPGAATNKERIFAGRKLSEAGFKTWFSIEPIIDFDTSFKMIGNTLDFAQLYKIGLKSGAKVDKFEANNFIRDVLVLIKSRKIPVYFKDSLFKQAEINREDLPGNCVNKDFNL